MASSNERIDLSPVTRALRDQPAFLAGWLSATPGVGQPVKDRLGLTEAAFERLLMCRAPRPATYLADVTAIADYIGVGATSLAAGLREAAVLAVLAQLSPSALQHVRPTGLLAAARDTAAEQLPVAQASSGVRELAAATWQAAPADVRERRDVQSALIWASPAMVVSISHLHLVSVNRWLAEHHVPPLGEGVGLLRGLLVAWRGQAAIFVDGTLAEAERRLTLAHEHGHLLLDYLVPRQRVLRDAPELLEVIDGNRSPTDADRARAALARVPLGVHTHMLYRDDQGGPDETTTRAEEEASVYALELLAPMDEVLALLRMQAAPDVSYDERLKAALGVVEDHFGLTAAAAHVRARSALAALGVRRGFFDR